MRKTTQLNVPLVSVSDTVNVKELLVLPVPEEFTDKIEGDACDESTLNMGTESINWFELKLNESVIPDSELFIEELRFNMLNCNGVFAILIKSYSSITTPLDVLVAEIFKLFWPPSP